MERSVACDGNSIPRHLVAARANDHECYLYLAAARTVIHRPIVRARTLDRPLADSAEHHLPVTLSTQEALYMPATQA